MLTICRVDYAAAIAPIQAIRCQVFQQEQGVAESLEFDGEDEAAVHFLAYWGDRAVGTTRLRYLAGTAVTVPAHVSPPNPETVAKIERVAVLREYRGQCIGQKLMEAAIAYLHQQKITVIKLNAQLSVQKFYERLGFQPQGDIFDEADIPHITMWYVPAQIVEA